MSCLAKPKGPKCNWCAYHADVLEKHRRWLKRFFELAEQIRKDLDDLQMYNLASVQGERLRRLKDMLP